MGVDRRPQYAVLNKIPLFETELITSITYFLPYLKCVHRPYS